MKVSNLIYRHILKKGLTDKDIRDHSITLDDDSGVEHAWGICADYGLELVCPHDSVEEFRGSGEATNIPCRTSRHYETEQVAITLSCGSSVSWVFWSGGGKHGEPESMDWIDDAFLVDCRTESKEVKIFTIPDSE